MTFAGWKYYKVTNEKCCPDCGNSESEGHWDKCYLYNALNGI